MHFDKNTMCMGCKAQPTVEEKYASFIRFAIGATSRARQTFIQQYGTPDTGQECYNKQPTISWSSFCMAIGKRNFCECVADKYGYWRHTLGHHAGKLLQVMKYVEEEGRVGMVKAIGICFTRQENPSLGGTTYPLEISHLSEKCSAPSQWRCPIDGHYSIETRWQNLQRRKDDYAGMPSIRRPRRGRQPLSS